MHGIVIKAVDFGDPLVRALLAEWDGELGFAPKGGSTVSAADFESPCGIFVVAERQGTPVGCGGLRRATPSVAEVKRLFVRPQQRGQGIGRTLLAHLEQHARRQGIEELRLDTDGGDPAALTLFRAAGYQPIPDYNGNPYARHWFAKRLAD